MISLRDLLALVSAHEWRKKGIPVPAVEGRIYPHFGVFSPVRGEYVDLVAKAPLPAGCDSWRSTSVPVPASWRPCWRGAASSVWSPPIRIREHCSAPRKMPEIWG